MFIAVSDVSSRKPRADHKDYQRTGCEAEMAVNKEYS